MITETKRMLLEALKLEAGQQVMTDKIARAASQDAGDRSMKKGGRTKWNEDDWNAASAEYTKLSAHTF